MHPAPLAARYNGVERYPLYHRAVWGVVLLSEGSL